VSSSPCFTSATLCCRQAVPARPNPNDSNPTRSLLIQYAPIEYVTLPIGIFATAFTQFLVRCNT
jgi:hypothetical protein